jgi:small acid-soluble spore protein D (minor alpha/beta-type SASP)
MANRNKLLVPSAKQGVNQLKAKVANTQTPDEAKYEIAKELGVPLKKGYNGSLTSRQAGKIGGNLGGNMVLEIVKMAEQQLKK